MYAYSQKQIVKFEFASTTNWDWSGNEVPPEFLKGKES